MKYDGIIAARMNTACTDCDQKRLVAAPFLPVPAGIRAAAGPFAVFAARGAMQVLWRPGQRWDLGPLDFPTSIRKFGW